MANLSQIKLPNNVTYDLKDSGALQLTGGQVTGPVTFGDSIEVDEATISDLVVNGSASFTNNLQVNTINGVTVGSSPKFTDTDTEVSTLTLASGSTAGTALAYGGKYTLTAGSKTVSFTMPASDNTNTTYTLSNALSSHKFTETLTAGGSGSGTSTATMEFVAGTGITLTDDTTNKKMTIACSVSNTDSKVSSSNSTSKLFLVGTTSQSSSGQAGYSNSGVYATNGALVASTFNGYTLAAACAKGVTDNTTETAISSSDTNLITGRTLYNAGYSKEYEIELFYDINDGWYIDVGYSAIIDHWDAGETPVLYDSSNNYIFYLDRLIYGNEVSYMTFRNQLGDSVYIDSSTVEYVPHYVEQTYTIDSSAWNNNNECSINATGVRNDSIVFVTPHPVSYDVYCEAGIRCSYQTTNYLHFHCEEKPSSLIYINVFVINLSATPENNGGGGQPS